MKRIALIGAGGHAKVVWDTFQLIQEQQSLALAAVLDDDPGLWGKRFMGVAINGPVASIHRAEIDAAIIAIGDNRARRDVYEDLRTRAIPLINVIHPKAIIAAQVQLGCGIVAFANVVVNIGSIIGDNVILNTACTVDHDCRIGPHTHLAPGVHLAGGVTVREGTCIGIGSAAIPNVTVGEWTTVGAGSVLVRDIPANVTAAGVPARILKRERHHGI